MKTSPAPSLYTDPSNHHVSTLCGLGAAGLVLLLGWGCGTTSEANPAAMDRDIFAADAGGVVADGSPAHADTGTQKPSGGLPLMDLAAPAVTRPATFALG